MFIRGLIFFFVLAAFSWVLTTQFNVPFGKINYFENHGIILLFGLALFPRLTLLFSSIASGGLFWWLSWLVFPRVLIATLATFAYFQTNPVLVTISWLVAFGGESFEKRTLRNGRVVVTSFGAAKGASQGFRTKNVNHTQQQNDNSNGQNEVIDVDFKKL